MSRRRYKLELELAGQDETVRLHADSMALSTDNRVRPADLGWHRRLRPPDHRAAEQLVHGGRVVVVVAWDGPRPTPELLRQLVLQAVPERDDDRPG